MNHGPIDLSVRTKTIKLLRKKKKKEKKIFVNLSQAKIFPKSVIHEMES